MLVGRDREVAAAAALIDRVADGPVGPPHVLVVAGEPGIGKSSILAEAVAAADARRWLTLVGTAGQHEHDLPFGVLVDALDDHVASQSALEVPVAATPVVPSRARASEPAEHSRLAVLRAVRTLLAELAGRRPLLLVLDDLQWADAGTLDTVAYLLRHPPPGWFALAVAFRSGSAPPVLVEAVATAVAAGRAERLDLAPLTFTETAELLGSTAAAHELHEAAGGNPFYLLEMARAGGAPTGSSADGLTSAPPALREALAAEVRGLPAAARTVLEAAAVVGDPFDPDLVAAAAQIDLATTLTAVDDLLAADLIRPADSPRRFRFRHPIIRDAVYEQAPHGWRLGAHQRVAVSLADRDAPATLRAPHVFASASPGDADAIATLAAAGEAATRLTPAIAARWYRAALSLVVTDDPLTRLGLLVPLAAAESACGALAESRTTLDEALGHVPPDLELLRIGLVASVAFVEQLLGRGTEARKLLEAELPKVADTGSNEAAVLYAELALDGLFAADHTAMVAWGERAATVAAAVGDVPLEASAHALCAFGRYGLGHVPEARERIAAAAAGFDDLPDHLAGSRLAGFLVLCMVEREMGLFGESVRHLDRLERIAVETGQAFILPIAAVVRSITTLEAGQVAAAVDSIERALEEADLIGHRLARGLALPMKCWILLTGGDVTGAVEAGRAAVEVDSAMVEGFAALFLAEALLRSGDAAVAIETLWRGAGDDLARIEVATRGRAWELLVEAGVAVGDDALLGAAPRELDAIDAVAGELGRTHLEVSRARARLALHERRWTDAVAAALEAADVAAGLHMPIDVARAWTLLGLAHAGAGDRDAALVALADADRELARCGALGFRAEAARALRQLGRRITIAASGQPAAPVAGLTKREREVAELVAEGRTNRQIAAQLFVTEKTVETHVTRVLGKLGLTSRAGVARALERLGAGDATAPVTADA